MGNTQGMWNLWIKACFCIPLTVTKHPCPVGSTVGQRWTEAGGESGGWGVRGCLRLKEACPSHSRHSQPSTPSSKWAPQQGLLCLRSPFIYSCSMWKTVSLILCQPPPPPPPPPSLCLTNSFSLKQDACRELQLSNVSSLTIRSESIQLHVLRVRFIQHSQQSDCVLWPVGSSVWHSHRMWRTRRNIYHQKLFQKQQIYDINLLKKIVFWV